MLILELFLFSLSGFASEKFLLPDHCISGQIRYVRYGKELIENADYCFDSKKTLFISKNCVLKKGKCLALISQRKPDDLVSEYGSPGFKLCYQINGLPQIVDFFDGESWIASNRCFFESDKSFINTDLLITHRSQAQK